jgi:Tol biopolymer transport system component
MPLTLICLFCILAVALAACGDTGHYATDASVTTEGLTLAWSPDGKWLVFPSSVNGGTPELYALDVARASGGGGRDSWLHLSQGFHDVIGPKNYTPTTFTYMAWSHDGQRLAFSANEEVYAFDTACLEKPYTCVESLTLIIDGATAWFGVGWSPDDSLLLVQGSLAGPLVDTGQGVMADDLVFLMRVVRADGSKETTFSRETEPREGPDWVGEVSFSPDWSPDGKSILYTAGSTDAPDLYLITLDDEQVQRLTDTPDVSEFSPEWSPDGSRILYGASTDDRTSYDVFIQDLEGGEPFCVTCAVHPSWKSSLLWMSWSPDGSHLAYTISGRKRLFRKWVPFYTYIIQPDGSGQLPVIEEGLPGPAFWSPDGTQLAFAFRPKPFWDSWESDIYLINVDGTGLTNLTD